MMKNAITFFCIFLLTGCTLLNEPEVYEYNTEKVLSETTNLIKKEYPYLTFKKINIDSLHNYFALRLHNYEGDKIYDLLSEYLYELKDGHVYFFTIGGFPITPYHPRRFNKDRYSYDPEVVRKYFKKELKLDESKKIEFGITSDNLGYIYISTFKLDGFKWINYFTKIIQYMKDTKGLIIDVRHNGGGSDAITYYIIGHFIQEPIEGPIWVDKNGNQIERGKIYPNTEVFYSKPIIVLQNGKCFSSAEGFINVMRELPNVTTIGDTTAGGSGAPEDFEIAENLTIHLSTKAEMTYDGKYIEWNGLEPDILVTQNKSDIEKGIDLQLESAISFLNNYK